MNKPLMSGFLFFIAAGAFAEEGLEAAKQGALENLTKRQSNLEAAKSCIKSATSREAMKSCHKELKEDQQAMRLDHIEKKQQRMNERMEKRKNKFKDSKE